MDDENKRIDIEDLPRAEEELTNEEAENVEGGAGLYRFYGDVNGDSAATKGNTIGGSLAGDVSNPVKP
jgi:hypothetical protein